MTMHLEGPWLSTTGKKRGPRKWASAEAKRKAQLLQQEWNSAWAHSRKWHPSSARVRHHHLHHVEP